MTDEPAEKQPEIVAEVEKQQPEGAKSNIFWDSTVDNVTCAVCGMPASVFLIEGGKVNRLTKTMRRITAKQYKGEALYTHETPCMDRFAQNWASYMLKHKSEEVPVENNKAGS